MKPHRRANERLPPIALRNAPPPSSAPGSQRERVQERPQGGSQHDRRKIIRETREQMLRLDIDELHPLVLEVVAELRERYDMETEESRQLLRQARLKRRKDYGDEIRLRR